MPEDRDMDTPAPSRSVDCVQSVITMRKVDVSETQKSSGLGGKLRQELLLRTSYGNPDCP